MRLADPLAALPAVARTGTHLFLFAGYVEQFRGWGRGLRRAVADWYVSKPVDFQRFIAVVRQIDEFFVSVVRLPS